MQERCKPAVQFETVVAYLTPVYSQNSSSNFFEYLPFLCNINVIEIRVVDGLFITVKYKVKKNAMKLDRFLK